jgi:outer membrane lipoprotein SlyB
LAYWVAARRAEINAPYRVESDNPHTTVLSGSTDAEFFKYKNKELDMHGIKRFWVTPVALAVGLAGCAAPLQQSYPGSNPPPSQGYPAQGQNYQLGMVDRIEVISRGAGDNVTGTIIGGIIGGLIGTQIGGGRGRTAATVVGAVGGAVAGNVIEGRQRADHETFRITVRLDNGATQTVTQDNVNDLRTGDRVRLDGNVISRV